LELIKFEERVMGKIRNVVRMLFLECDEIALNTWCFKGQ